MGRCPVPHQGASAARGYSATLAAMIFSPVGTAGVGLSGSVLSTAAGRALLVERGGSGISYTLVRGLLVLGAFPAGGPARGVTEVAQELEMKTSTVHRFVATLVALELLERDVERRLYRRPAISFES